jgi:REP element-mobilizing transposase RayT
MAEQLQLEGTRSKPKPPTWGGLRKGAGRKPNGKKAMLSHARRPFHEGAQPVLVTERFVRGLPWMRSAKRGKAIADCMRESASRTFRVIHFSIQDDHLHLVVEAGSKRSLSRGMQGLKIRMAKRLNRALGRRTGTVFHDRYHARALGTPTAVRVAIRYVLCNWKKHVEGASGLDPYSSARWFNGWVTRTPAQTTTCPVARPVTWLGRAGWRRKGLLRLSERPGEPPG